MERVTRSSRKLVNGSSTEPTAKKVCLDGGDTGTKVNGAKPKTTGVSRSHGGASGDGGNKRGTARAKKSVSVKKEPDTDGTTTNKSDGKRRKRKAEPEVDEKSGQPAKNGSNSGPSSDTNKSAKVKTEPAKNGSNSGPKKSEKIKTKSAKKGSKSETKKSAKVKTEPVAEIISKKVVLKGKAPVDPECHSLVEHTHVYYSGRDVYDVMLNQTNLQNNNNKYYLIQLLEDDSAKRYNVWMRWGRVGKLGQNSLQTFGPDLEAAKATFCKKFHDKTKNYWEERDYFQKVVGKYDTLKMDYGTKDQVDAPKKAEPQKNVPKSSLDTKVQALVELICDVKAMEAAVLEMKYDAHKAPLGKLTVEQIKAGYSALKIIDNCITKNILGKQLLGACNDFYTRIPHDFGMRRPPLIQTKEEMRLKLQLLEALGDIQIAITMLKGGNEDDNPVDRHYKSLECHLNPLPTDHNDYQIVNKYLINTHADTHNQYSLELLDVFQCRKDVQEEQFKDLGNKMLLWHGSRLTNWAGILNQGLRIAPPEAPVTGYMFGKGVYFADMSSKSINYCFPTRARNVGLALLCEVSLGEAHQLLAADYEAHRLPPGKHSVTGMGKTAPDPTQNHTMSCGTTVPLGKGKTTGTVNPSGYTLNYNEYIVYDTKQIKMRYLCKVKFNFK